MFIKISINADSTAGELIAVSHFTNELALNRGAKVAVGPLVAPTDPAELDEPEVVVCQTTASAGAENTAGTEPPKRKRRTKEEIAAANAATTAEPVGPFYWSHPESDSFGQVSDRAGLEAILNSDSNAVEVSAEQYAELVAKKQVQQPASDDGGSRAGSEAEEFEIAAVTRPSGKNYTEAEVQQIATVVARTHGADKVKSKIAELGGQRIAGLGQDKLNQLGDYLDGLSKTPTA